MAAVRRRRQASRGAPWRGQLQWTSGTLLWLVLLLVVGGMYLAVNAKVAAAGREVLTLEDRRLELQRDNAELGAQLAKLSAPDRMIERARAMGFRPAGPEEIEYLIVEGYQPPPVFSAPSPPASTRAVDSSLSPAYTETLGEWLSRWLGRSGGRP